MVHSMHGCSFYPIRVPPRVAGENVNITWDTLTLNDYLFFIRNSNLNPLFAKSGKFSTSL